MVDQKTVRATATCPAVMGASEAGA
jgi:hypothetical protein